MATRAAARPYHHGNLAAALLDAAVEMAAEGGPDSVVLREVARRVGVSATAAYRHFAGQADLAEAVKNAALDRLAAHLRAALELADTPPGGAVSGDVAPDGAASGGAASGARAMAGLVPLPGVVAGSREERAIRRLESLGRAYFDFAVTQPGLFRCFCIGLPVPGSIQVPGSAQPQTQPQVPPQAPGPGSGTDVRREAAFGVLADALDDLVTAGVLSPERRASGVDIALWSAVHGLSVLCLDGPLADLPREVQESMLTAVTDVIFHGLAGPR